MTGKYLDQVILGDMLKILPDLPDKSVDLVLTDPPYFLDKMDNHWDNERVSSPKHHQVVRSLPAGMKFDKEQGRRFYKWYYEVSTHILRVLKPGGFFFSFSSPRLYHRMVSAIDDAGFLIRDSFIWLYTQNQPKAMGLNHFIDRLKEEEETKEHLKKGLKGWKTPQVKSCFEPIAMAQKEVEGTFLDNFRRYNVGLVNSEVKLGDSMFPSNVISSDNINPVIDRCFLVSKPDKGERGDFNIHKTVKPLSLCEYLIKLTTYSDDAVVLDPFCGSGTTLLAAKKLKRRFIGIDINKEYVDIALLRINQISDAERLTIEKRSSRQLQLYEKETVTTA